MTVVYEQINGPLSSKVENFSKFSQLLAACGHNPTNKFLKSKWNNDLEYSDFVLAAEKLSENNFSVKEVFRQKFGKQIER